MRLVIKLVYYRSHVETIRRGEIHVSADIRTAELRRTVCLYMRPHSSTTVADRAHIRAQARLRYHYSYTAYAALV